MDTKNVTVTETATVGAPVTSGQLRFVAEATCCPEGKLHNEPSITVKLARTFDLTEIDFRFIGFVRHYDTSPARLDPHKLLLDCKHIMPTGYKVVPGSSGKELVVFYANPVHRDKLSLELHRELIGAARISLVNRIEQYCAQAHAAYRVDRFTRQILSR